MKLESIIQSEISQKKKAPIHYINTYIWNLEGFPGRSEVKTSSWNAGDPGSILSWEDPLEKKMATHSSTLAWKIPWTEEPGRLQSMGSLRVGHD